MKAFKAFIKPFEAPQRSVKKTKLTFSVCPGSEREELNFCRSDQIYKNQIVSSIYPFHGIWYFPVFFFFACCYFQDLRGLSFRKLSKQILITV